MSRASKVGLLNELEQSINPATEEKQDDLIAKDFATSAKQLPDNHRVTVSNPTADPETGLAKEAKQLPDGHNVNIEGLDAPVTTVLTLTNADTAYKMPASELANRKLLVIYNASDTDVYIGSSSVTTDNGILIPAGGTMSLDCEKDLYAVCGTAGKQIRILELS